MINKEIFRPEYEQLKGRISESRRFIQVLLGPRQVGKTTISRQIANQFDGLSHYANADYIVGKPEVWVEQQWEKARAFEKSGNSVLLILDEIQKVKEWSSIIKLFWDEDTFNKHNIKLLLLGSSTLLLHKGLSESLAGRFEVIPVAHWRFKEMRDAFGFSIEQYVYFGGYPGAASLIGDEDRWKKYVLDALVENTISKDILMLEVVKKPALLKQMFYLGCDFSGQILSFNKMLGQLQDAGNATTLSHYLDLTGRAGLLCGLQNWHGEKVQKRSTSPKFQVYNTALMSALGNGTIESVRTDGEAWGRWVESCVGAYLINSAFNQNFEVKYYRNRGQEVDFIVEHQGKILAIEVKSGGRFRQATGLDKFSQNFKPHKAMVVGTGGIDLESFLKTPLSDWFR